MQEVVDHFGEPEKFVDEYWLSIDPQERGRLFNHEKWVKRIIAVFVIAVILIIGISSLVIVIRNDRTAGYSYHYEIITDSNPEPIISDH